jgi:hypothetical protein
LSGARGAGERRLIVVLAGLAGALTAWLACVAMALAASPVPSAGTGGDPRSSGQGPGLVGDPLFAIAAVVVIGVVALVATLGWVRLTADRGA